MKQPVFSSSDGRTVIGYASNPSAAARALKKMLDIPQGFVLNVWERSPIIREILDLPSGYVYAVSYSYRSEG